MRDKLNCPNCGAPIVGIKCEYCGTQFFDIADIEIGKPGYLRMRVGNEVNKLIACPTNVDVRVERIQPMKYWHNDVVVPIKVPDDITVNIELKIIPDNDGIQLRKVFLDERSKRE